MTRVVITKSNRREGKPGRIVAFEYDLMNEPCIVHVEDNFLSGSQVNFAKTTMTVRRARALWAQLWGKGYRRLSDKCRA